MGGSPYIQPSVTMTPHHVRESKLSIDIRKLNHNLRTVVSPNTNLIYTVGDIDIQAAIEVIAKHNIMHSGKPRKELMNMLNAIYGVSKNAPFTYNRPHTVGRSKRKSYLSHAGFQVLDGLAAKNERFKRFVEAYDSKDMRKRAQLECTQLLLGVLPGSFDEMEAYNKENAHKVQERKRRATLFQTAKAIVKHIKAAPTKSITGLLRNTPFEGVVEYRHDSGQYIFRVQNTHDMIIFDCNLDKGTYING